ncbi:Alg9-like mannosyltransferase family-domain-containing protein [Crucibulum laeve]|uniref:Mannosyltransferase n=1 Tax=Crucibulum laeve TaxID=68775 RepID=A0A5C3MA71_9AGAR|nr:Alg9-like mannosyltransferase family-domain-containing protein [Crucibulum laeve]
MLSLSSTAYLSILVRVIVALCTRTVFQPDEYFQSLEPAYQIVFGYGHLTWEWLAPKPIRSILYPALNVPIYWLLKISGLADAGALGDWLLILLPKVLHGLFASAADIWLCELTRLVLGNVYVSTALFLSLSSFFNALSLSRSLSNSLETSLCTIAYASYPWDASPNLSSQLMFNRSRLRKTLIFSALACMVRPTNAIIWVFLYGKLLWGYRSHKKLAVTLLLEALVVGGLALLSLFAIDTIYYSKPTFTPLNFLLTNLSSVSLFYGSNPWHYYLSQALPILCTTALPFTLHGIWLSISEKRSTALKTMFATVIWSIGIYSLAGHKEWRFIHPILPLLYVFAAKSLVDLSHGYVTKRTDKPKPKSRRAYPSWSSNLRQLLPPIRPRYVTLLLATLPASLYIVLFYCSGPVSVLSYIRSLSEDELRNGSIGVLMPCHSTPGHAYLHREMLANGSMWSLGCEPPLENQALAVYHDQTDVFFSSPISYLKTYFPKKVNPSFPQSPFPTSIPGAPSLQSENGIYPWKHEWPRHLIFFGDLLRQDGVKSLLEQQGYKEVWKGGREWEGEGQRKGAVRVWKWNTQAANHKYLL